MAIADPYDEAGRPAVREIRMISAEQRLEIDFDDSSTMAFSAEFLRVESPSAEVRGHSPSERQYIGGKLNVRVTEIEPVGNYAIRITFDDGHNTGIFSWSFLYDAGVRYEEIWENYLNELDQRGISRT